MSPAVPARFAAPAVHVPHGRNSDPRSDSQAGTGLLTRPDDRSLTTLATLVRALAANTGLWRAHVKFTETRYWTRLPAPVGVDVWLLTWLPEQGTELHDHGDSAAAFTVVSGALTEVRVDDEGELSASELHRGAVRTVSTGVVHDVHNHHNGPAVSIHAYSPKLLRMTYYRLGDVGLEPTRTVLGDEPEESSRGEKS
jgi:mannose-6-phosphate isomerase-like protein (cupin superfamily)